MSRRGLPPVERRSTPNSDSGRQGHSPLAIVVHTTQGTAAQTAGWFALEESGTSAHYLVALDGGVTQFVEEADTARHAGRILRPSSRLVAEAGGDPNTYTVGIEFEDGGEPMDVRRPRAQYTAGARLISTIARRWGIPLDREHLIGHREVYAAKDCPGNLDLGLLLVEARKVTKAVELAGGRPTSVACLLPVRNGAEDLPSYLECVEGFADTVIALDDGSTDTTRETLEASPLVSTVLTNPRRSSFEGWDDAANRQALLDAAGDLAPDWIVFLDVDERLDAEDGAALREFLGSDAVAGCAYGFRLHRSWDEGRVAERSTCVYRAFGYAPGQTLPGQRLHFNPVPVQIPRRAWLRTTIRIRHLDSRSRLKSRHAKYGEADPSGAFAAASERLLLRPEDPLVDWIPRPGDAPVLDFAGAKGARPSRRRRIVFLLPARNCESDLPGYLESVSPVADAIVALDDGSTDGTAEALSRAELVRVLLRNPQRDTYAGWDDRGNRQRLLDAAGELEPDWVMFLDADERIDAEDAAALEDFVQRQAEPGHAYGFRVHRMIGDRRHYDRADLWAYRLFGFESGAWLPPQRLHLVPVPTSIPRERWLKTTIRIQHLAGLSAERRILRSRKYEAADPDRRWQPGYSHLLSEPDGLKPWRPRPRGMPALADPLRQGPGAELDLELLDLNAPVLSAIVISRDDEHTIERSVRSVVEQECPEDFEVIVVVSGTDRTAQIVRERLPNVELLELSEPALPGAARNAGLSVARGDYVSFPGSHVELAPGSLAARIRAHELGYTMVTGSIVNGTRTRSGWASYFLDHSTALPGRPSGELGGAPAHCSYAREFLLELGGFPEDLRAGEDTAVNQELRRRGHRAYREQEITLVHNSRCTGPLRLIRHHFTRGRALVRVFLGHAGEGRGSAMRFLAGYTRRRLSDTRFRVARWQPDLQPEYARARPLIVIAVLSAWLGAMLEVALGKRRAGGERPSTIRFGPTGAGAGEASRSRLRAR